MYMMMKKICRGFRFSYLRVTLPICIIYTFIIQKLRSDCASFTLCFNCMPYAYKSGQPHVMYIKNCTINSLTLPQDVVPFAFQNIV